MRAPVLARAAGYAFGLANYRDDAEELTLQLARDDVPISGRIIDLQGQPVVGATVAVLEVRLPAGGSLDGWLKDLEERKAFYGLDNKFLPVGLWSQTDPPLIPPVKTGADGRFLHRRHRPRAGRVPGDPGSDDRDRPGRRPDPPRRDDPRSWVSGTTSR